MLVNPRLQYDPHLANILSLIGQGGKDQEIETGIFISPSFSFNNSIQNKKNEYFGFVSEDEYLGPYGVCDNAEQVKQKYSKWLNDPELKFCVSFTKITKSEEPESGGWRWHKWGSYIGDKNPQCEYIYDEDDDIQEVYCYHIYQLLD